MIRNAAPLLRVLVVLPTLSLLNLFLPTRAGQPATFDPRVLVNFAARSIGPANMGGRTVAIAGVESNPKIIFAGTASGGLWKTTDGGETWKAIFDKQSSVCIGDVAVSQANPDIVWVGTGEHNPRNSVAWGDGVYKSTDGGNTWMHMGLRDSHSIGRIAIHPKNPDIVYVGVLGHIWAPNKERGVYKTIDGGKNWELCKFIDEDTGIIDLKIDPTQPDILYAAAYTVRRDAFSGSNPVITTGPGAGLYKTTDAGKTWEKMAGGLPDNPNGRCGLDIYRKDPNVVYAVVQTDKTVVGEANQGNVPNGKGGPDAGGIFRSEDKGQTWKQVNTLVPRPFYFGQVRIDPNDDARIYVLGVTLYVSDDAGKTFQSRFTAGLGNPLNSPHADHHALWINPNNSDEIFEGNDGGIWQSKDKAKSFQHFMAMALGQYYGISVDMSRPYWVYGGLQDNGGWGGPSATFDSAGIRTNLWFTISGGDGFHTQNDPTDPNIVYSEMQYGNPVRANVAGKGQKVAGKGGGVKYSTITSPRSQGGRFNWSTPMLLSPHDPKTVFYGSNVLLMSNERGLNWKRISPNLTYGSDASKAGNAHTLFTVGESPRKRGIIWTGSDDGCIFVTRDGGDRWVDVSAIPGMPKESCISRVEPSSFDEATCYVSITRYRNDDRRPYIFKTTDFGNTWQNLSANLPESGSVHVVVESSRNPSVLFCGTEFGLFVTVDGGKAWHPMKTGLPTVAVHDLVIHPRDRDLVIGTHGRGIFVIDDIGPLEELTGETLSSPAHLFAVRPAVAFKWQESPRPKSNEFVGQNPPYGALIRYHLKQDVDPEVSVSIADPAGKPIISLKGGNTEGLHQVVWDLGVAGDVKTTVPPGDYWAQLNAGSRKQFARVRVDPEPKAEEKVEKKTDNKDAEAKKAEDKKDDNVKKKDDKKADDKNADDTKKKDDAVPDKKGRAEPGCAAAMQRWDRNPAGPSRRDSSPTFVYSTMDACSAPYRRRIDGVSAML
jgi:photosystem II stability/assembly factor-like uncharacterized protein